MRRVSCTGLAIACALTYGAVPVRAAEPQPKPTVALEVDVSALPDDEETEQLREQLVELQARILGDGGLEVVEDGAAGAKIRVNVSRYGDGDVNYRFTVTLHEHGAATMERTLVCDLCRDAELAAKVGEEVARVSGRLVYQWEAGVQGREGAAGDPAGEDVPEPKVRRVGGGGWAGIAMAAAGVGFAAGGAIELAKPARRELVVGDRTTEKLTEPRLLGSTLLGVGLGLVVGGAVLIVVDQTVLLERRRRRNRGRSLAPSFSATSLGLAWGGRF